MGIFGSRVNSVEELIVNESNFVSVLFEKIKEHDVQVIFSANDLHTLAKVGWCRNYLEGYTPRDDGTCMKTSDGILRMCKIAYTIYPQDLYDDLVGVESVLNNVFDRYGIATYQRPLNPQKTYLLKYVPKT